MFCFSCYFNPLEVNVILLYSLTAEDLLSEDIEMEHWLGKWVAKIDPDRFLENILKYETFIIRRYFSEHHRTIQLMLELIKAPFMVLHFFYYTLMTFLMMLSLF